MNLVRDAGISALVRKRSARDAPRRSSAGRARPARRLRSVAATLGAVGLGSVLLASCSGYSGSIGHEVAQWASGASLGANDAYIVADVHDIATGIAHRALLDTHTACDGLATDAATAYGELPTPDATLTGDLNDAYLGFTHAAQACSAAPSFAHGGFTRYEKLEQEASRKLAAARRLLAGLGDG